MNIKIVKLFQSSLFQLKSFIKKIVKTKKNIDKEKIKDICMSAVIHDPWFEQNLIYIEKVDNKWYDLKIINEDTNIWYPVKIELTNTDLEYHLSCKESLIFSLTGIDPEHVTKNSHWSKIIEMIKSNNIQEHTDVFYIIIDNKEKENVIINTLKSLKNIELNINHFPFLINWSLNNDFDKERIIPTKELLNKFKELIMIFENKVKKEH